MGAGGDDATSAIYSAFLAEQEGTAFVSGDGTNKLLLQLHDGHLVECVLLHEADRHTACISTQVGCGMGCVFCASGINGVERNLTGGEHAIDDQR